MAAQNKNSLRKVMKTVRKPMAPPVRVEVDFKKYRRKGRRGLDWLKDAEQTETARSKDE